MTSQRESGAQPSVADLVDYLCDGISVQLVGLPGSGRSLLARRVVDELGDAEYDTVWVKAIAPLRDRPLAALALAGVPIEPVPASVSTTMVVAKAADALGKTVGRKRAALVIDDAEHLDGASGGVILAAHARKPFPILFIDRPGRDADELVNALATECQPGVRLSMSVLPFDDIHQLVDGVLRGTVEPEVVARLAILSGGLPRLVRAMVDAARRSGQLTRTGEVWHLAGDLWDERLVQVVRPLLRGLSGEDVGVLAALARAVDGQAVVETVVTDQPDAVMRLREAGLLRVSGRVSGRLVSVFPPLLAEYLRRHGPLDSWVTDADRRPVGWRDRLPRGVDASEYASRLESHWRAEVAALKREWEQRPDDAHSAHLLAAMHAAGAGPAEIATVLDGVRLSGDDAAASATVTAWSAVYRAIAGRDLDGALAELDERRALVPDADGYLSAYKAHLCFLNGRALETGPMLAAARPQLSICREALAGVRVENLIATGLTSQALDVLTGAEAGDPVFEGHYRICTGLARVLGDDVKGGVDWALDHLADAVESLDASVIDGHSYTAALGMTLMGALDDLDDLVDVVFRFPCTTTLHRHYRAGLLSLAAIAKAWEGRTEQAARLAAQAAAMAAGVGPYPGMLVALDSYLDPRLESRELWDTVEERLRHGYVAAAVFCAVPAVERSVDGRRAAAVVTAGAASESAVVRALTGYVAAVAAGDGEALLASAGELRSACGPVYAMRALIARARLLQGGGDNCAAAAQVDEAWHESGDLGARCPGLFVPFSSSIELTPREREVITLVARGFSSTGIASEAEVTRRTVETHTSAAYRKIGVRNRKELCDALGTWLVV